jgi:GAF domain-containing protein
VIARAARERRGVIVSDATREANFMSDPRMPETRSELAVPLIAGGNLLGVFDIQSDQVGRFTEADISVQTTLAAQVSTSIQNVRSFEQSKSQAQLESLVNIVSQKIQRTTSVEETLQTAIQEVSTALGGARVSAKIRKTKENEFTN